MTTLRKIVAVVLMILAVFGFVVCVGGFIGTVVYRPPIIEGTVAGLAVADQYLNVINRTVQAVNTQMPDVVQRLERVEQVVATASDARGAQLDAQVSQLAAPIGRVGEMLGTVSQGITALEATLTTVNRLPGVNLQPLPPQLVEATDRIDRLSNGFAQVESTINASTFDGSRARAAVGNVVTEAKALQVNVQQAETRLAATQTAVQRLQARAPQLLTMTLLGLGLFLLLLAAGQAALFKVSWDWFRKG